MEKVKWLGLLELEEIKELEFVDEWYFGYRHGRQIVLIHRH